MNRTGKFLVLGFLGFLIAGWNIWQYQEAQIVCSWAAHESSSKEVLLQLAESGEISETLRANLAVANIYANELFPPNHQKALDYYLRAAAKDPLNSVIWYRIAREKALTGQTEQARSALRRSDQLDPYFPQHRLTSIQLWAALDDPQHSMDVARSLSQLGGVYRMSAARELAAIGLTPVEIFDAMELDQADPFDQIKALSVVGTSDPEMMRPAFARINWDQLDDSQIRNHALRVAIESELFEESVRIWRMEAPDILEAPAWVIHNPRLVDSPFEHDFALGWQRFPDQSGLEYRWLSPEGLEDIPQGTIVINFDPKSKDIKLSWTLYKFLMPPNSISMVSLKLRQRPANRLIAGVQVRVNGSVIANSRIEPPDFGWSRFPVQCVTKDAPGLVEVRLMATRTGGDLSELNTIELQLGGLEVSSPSDASPSEASDNE